MSQDTFDRLSMDILSTTLLHDSLFVMVSVVISHRSKNQEVRGNIFFFVLPHTYPHRRTHWITLPDSEKGRVNGLDYAPRRNGFTDIYIFRQLHSQHDSVLYMTLPAHMTS